MAGYKAGPLASPFTEAILKTVSDQDPNDVRDHNSCPYFSHPHSMGPDTIPVTFDDGGIPVFHGNIEGQAANVSSTMGGGRKK